MSNTLTFITDDGSENVYRTVNSLVQKTKHLIAQKNIQFSNSGIKALNKVMKLIRNSFY